VSLGFGAMAGVIDLQIPILNQFLQQAQQQLRRDVRWRYLLKQHIEALGVGQRVLDMPDDAPIGVMFGVYGLYQDNWYEIKAGLPRLKQVVDGEQGGISKAVNWLGGGGFKFYELAPSLLNEDKFGNLVINKEYNSSMLAAAMTKQEGYRYLPDETVYWKQGKSSEQDYIYTTTQFITLETLERIHDEMQPGESLLICCTAFQNECKNRFGNITIKKIPQILLGRCEFGKEDYSLNIVNIPTAECEEDDLCIDNEQSDQIQEGQTEILFGD
jgi:hypothetical protein